MENERQIVVRLTEEEAYQWLKLCRAISGTEGANSTVALADRLAVRLTRELTQLLVS